MVRPDTVKDSRRLTGPNLLIDRPGAVLEVELADATAAEAVRAWQEEAQLALDALGWTAESLAARRFPGGASLALTAPIDALYAATEVNEWAWSAATARLNGDPIDRPAEFARLAALIGAERRPALLALRGSRRPRGALPLGRPDRLGRFRHRKHELGNGGTAGPRGGGLDPRA